MGSLHFWNLGGRVSLSFDGRKEEAGEINIYVDIDNISFDTLIGSCAFVKINILLIMLILTQSFRQARTYSII